MDAVLQDDGPPERSDEFTSAKKRLFLLALRKGETTTAACEMVGVSRRTAYNHRDSDPDFAHFWKLAKSMATLPLDLVAWERAVIGVEEPVYAYGKFSHMRLRRSDTLLRKVLEAEHPKKYARARIASRRRILKAERDRIREEIEAEISAKQPSFEEAIEQLDRQLRAFGLRRGVRMGDSPDSPESGNDPHDPETPENL
jgi:hypothetical protein